jgi:hypothetical protein
MTHSRCGRSAIASAGFCGRTVWQVVCQELQDIAGKPRVSFLYLDKGIMAMIGRNAAVAEVGKNRYELEGVVAFAASLGVHAALLASPRPKSNPSWNRRRIFRRAPSTRPFSTTCLRPILRQPHQSTTGPHRTCGGTRCLTLVLPRPG